MLLSHWDCGSSLPWDSAGKFRHGFIAEANPVGERPRKTRKTRNEKPGGIGCSSSLTLDSAGRFNHGLPGEHGLRKRFRVPCLPCFPWAKNLGFLATLGRERRAVLGSVRALTISSALRLFSRAWRRGPARAERGWARGVRRVFAGERCSCSRRFGRRAWPSGR